jgi:glucokinase
LPGWHYYPIRQRLSVACGSRPVTFMNDANAAAYGEFWVGEGHAAQSLVLLTLGTGVGGGIILDDRMWAGHHDHGAELGHLCLDHSPAARRCGCGGLGHLEAYASATAVVQRTQEALAGGATSSLQPILTSGESLTALQISEHAQAGDDLALKIIQETAHYIGWAVADLAHTIDPELFLIGGAMNFGGAALPLGQRFLATIRDTAASLTFPIIAQNLRVEFASLRGEAGWIGAAGWARRSSLRN